MTDPRLRFDAVGFRYRDGPWVLRGCSGAVRSGEILAVLGPNGRGKSTLLRLLLGTLDPLEGQIERMGHAAFVPQSFDVAFDYEVLDIVLTGRARHVPLLAAPGRVDERAAFAALERFGITALAHQRFGALSGGQRQLVLLARALAAEAEILLLDEPTASLDMSNQERLLGLIKQLARVDGRAVIFTTHHPGHALTVSDQAILMIASDCFECGPTSKVLTDANLTTLYKVEMRRICFEHQGRTLETITPVSDAREV